MFSLTGTAKSTRTHVALLREGVSLDGREGRIESVLMRQDRFGGTGFDKCRRCQMPDLIEPFQPIFGSHAVKSMPGAVKVRGQHPHLVTLRDHPAERVERPQCVENAGSVA